MAPPVPSWVIHKVQELVARATPVPIIAGQLVAMGYPCTARSVKRWKVKHGIRQTWRGDDVALDAVVQRLRDDDELGAEEGYRWVQSVVNDAIPGSERVGAARVRKAIKRAMPAAVNEREKIVEKQLQRRIYIADYRGQRHHIDLECKLQFGPVRIYIFGLVRAPAYPTLPNAWSCLFVSPMRSSTGMTM